ncbi:MAG TPA: bifunctional YncE family protein/alkaline phosphatase family protein [Acidocella sp.]|nr:bifunctional YncE family protein/alkaline phosphatase family protein [Acidocella sp.]
MSKFCWVVLAAAISISVATAHADNAQTLPSGALLTPNAAPDAELVPLNPHLPAFPNYTAGQVVNMALSPDGKTLLILTSGFNIMFGQDGKPDPAASNEYVFVEDVSSGRPVQRQVLQIPDTYIGLTFAPDGQHFYVSGGNQDNVHIFATANGQWHEDGAPIALGHLQGVDPKSKIYRGGSGLNVQPETAGLAVTADGKYLLAANFNNDTLSIINLASHAITEVPLRPGDIDPHQTGLAGGEYPFEIAVKGSATAYISSLRDREIDVVALSATPHVTARIKLHGNPLGLVLNQAGSLLYVACDNSDDVAVIDTANNIVKNTIRTIAPPAMLVESAHYRGVGPNNLTLAPDQKTLYVTNGGTNSLAVISLGAVPNVTGLIPTGYFPEAVSVSADGRHLYVINGKSIPGPNPGHCTSDPARNLSASACDSTNQYILQLSKAGLLDFPVPDAAQLAQTTLIAAHNEHFDEMPSPTDERMMAALHARIKHIIYVLRENRTYDEELGDLGEGNGAANLAEFGKTITPNAHQMALNFVDLDNFYDSGEVSGNGWPWSVSAHESDIGARNLPVSYAERGLSYDWEGTNRNIDVAILGVKAREAEDPALRAIPDIANVLPGVANLAAPDGPKNQYQRGYLWDAALRAGLTVRNYGFFEDLERYFLPVQSGGIPATLTDPAAQHFVVAFPTNPALAPRTDLYFRGFDNAFPDFYREQEWQREFDNYVRNNNLPSLSLVRLMHDHLGNFKNAIDGVNTPETQMADNDYAVAKLIAAVADSKYASSTLIFVVEDDAQNGPDHVDAHRSVAYIVGPYVKHHAVISTHYTTVNFLRTMEDILGIDHLSINDAFQRPMTDIFDLQQTGWQFTPIIPAPLMATSLPVPKMQANNFSNMHPASWWAAHTAGYDWSQEDKIPAGAFNRLLWMGLHHQGVLYPTQFGIVSNTADRDVND